MGSPTKGDGNRETTHAHTGKGHAQVRRGSRYMGSEYLYPVGQVMQVKRVLNLVMRVRSGFATP